MAPEVSSHRLAPLVLLEVATLVSGVGNGMILIVLPWLVLERTGDPGAAGLVAAATSLPLLASSLFSGTAVDMLGRRPTAVVSDLLSGVSAAAIPLVDYAFGLDLWLIMGLAVVGAVFDPAGVTARETMLPGAADRAGWSLQRVNGLHEATWGVAFLIGPGIAGVLIAWIGASATMWVAATGFVLSAVCVTIVRVPGAGRPAEHHRPEGIWHGTKEGLLFAWRDPLLRAITLLSAALVAVYLPIEGVLLPVYFEARDEPGKLGVLLMAISAGGVVGALLYAALGDRIRRSVAFKGSLLLTSVVLVGLAVLPSYGLMIIFGFGLGLAYGPVSTLINLATQVRSPERLRGRVVGIVTATDYAAGPLAFLLAGYAVDRFGVEPVFISLAAGIIVVAVAGALLPSIRHLDDRYEGDEEAADAAHGPVEALSTIGTAALPLVSRPQAHGEARDNDIDPEWRTEDERS